MTFPADWKRGGMGGAAVRGPFLFAILIACLPVSAGWAATYSVAGFSDTAVVTGLSQPTTITWTPDGRMLILEKAGRVRIVVNGVLQAAAALDITASVDSGFEKGLLGICLDPGFFSNGYLYLYYTTRVPQNRISRFTMTGNSLSAASETVILDGIDATNGNHNGGNILIGPDGKLWAAPGDSGTGGAKSQILTGGAAGSLNGKVLRMELNGSAAAGNPFLGDPTKEGRIWAYGFRNPFRFTFRPSNGSLYVADVGESTFEEIDVVTTGGNYGWPMAEGTLGSCTGCTPPVFEYDHTVGQAIIGGVFVVPGTYPAFLRGKYLVGDYVSSWIKYLDFTAGDTVSGTLQNLATSAENPVYFAIGPDRVVYYVAIGSGKVYRINPPPANYFTVTPCRVLDTRNANGPLGGPALVAGASRAFAIAGQCGIPADALSVSVNVTITGPTALGNLTFYPSGTPPPLVSTINYRPGQTRANNAVLPLGANGDFNVLCIQASGAVHFLLDVNGYYQ
jgi:glucose/arabinose dehydrogenase